MLDQPLTLNFKEFYACYLKSFSDDEIFLQNISRSGNYTDRVNEHDVPKDILCVYTVSSGEKLK